MRSSIIPNFENFTIYENGDIYSKTRRGGGGKLTPYLTKNGYYRVNLTKDSKNNLFFIHRLLAICFIDNPDNKPFIDHIDRNRTNNNLNNLRWVTNKENCNNKDKPKGYIHINKRTYGDKTYEYIRYCYYEDGKKKSKNFKTIEEAEDYKRRFNL